VQLCKLTIQEICLVRACDFPCLFLYFILMCLVHFSSRSFPLKPENLQSSGRQTVGLSAIVGILALFIGPRNTYCYGQRGI